ncbi:MAG TPA: hypothetical protein VLH77_06755 [Gammaproteobacteria bacterium]|nr:hypothetical protein [Gammaproteobacteria bacterium]
MKDIKEYANKPFVFKTMQGKVTNFNSSDDFISGISSAPEMRFSNKSSLLAALDALHSDRNNTQKQTELFRQIEQTTLLSRAEKVTWLKPRIDRLPAPFAMLLATLVAPDNLDEAFQWKVLSQLRMKIDARKCQDNSVAQGIKLIEYYYLDNLFELMTKHYVKKQPASKLNNTYLNAEFNRRNFSAIPAVLQYHKTHPYKIEQPYWLANHGMNHILALMQGNINHKGQLVSKKRAKEGEAELLKIFSASAK